MSKTYNSLNEYLQENNKRDRHIIFNFFRINSSNLTELWNTKTVEQFNKICKYDNACLLLAISVVLLDLVSISINNSTVSLLTNLIIFVLIITELYLLFKITKCREIVDDYISRCNEYLINAISSDAYFPGEDKLDSINNLVSSMSFMLNIRKSNRKEARKLIEEAKANNHL